MELPQPPDNPPRPETLCSDKVMLSLSSSLLQPHPPVWITLSDFPFGYTKSLGHSRAILTATQTFPTLTARHCMIAICSTPEDPIGACPIFFPIGNSHRLLTTDLTSSSLKSRRFHHMFAFATALMLARHTPCDLYFRAFIRPGHPAPMSDITTDPKWELIWQDLHLLAW